MALTAAQTRQSPRAFSLDESFERLADQAGFFRQAGQGLSLGNKLIVQSERRAHFDGPTEAH
jgi:hypothetical protein